MRFWKIANPQLATNPAVAALVEAQNTQATVAKPLRAIRNVGGYSAVFMPGESPSFVLGSSKSLPRVLRLKGPGVKGLSAFHTVDCERGFIYIEDSGITRFAQLPANSNYDIGWHVKQVQLGQSPHGVTYHAATHTYVVGTSVPVEFEVPKDEHRGNRASDDISFKPIVERSFVKLISPSDWSIICTIELDAYEMIMCVEVLDLALSETGPGRKQLVVVGTAICKGEDLAARGRIYVYDIVNVVPEPGRPQTGQSLKLVAREDVRGAVTAISEIGTQGFMLVAQGQKCIVRGLKDDGSILPVAFLDMNCYVTSMQELRGTGLCVMADARKGVWFVGYNEEPYKMQLLGKSTSRMEAMVTSFLPDGKDLYVIVVDAHCHLHVLQYDPERTLDLSQ